MSDMKTVLVAFNDKECVFGSVDLRKLMGRALRVEERMTSRVLIEDEQRRYNTFCDRIEFYGNKLLSQGKSESCDLGSDYLDLVSKIVKRFPEEATKMRLTACFCPKEKVASYLNQFKNLVRLAKVSDKRCVQEKEEFYKKALQKNLNVVELIQAWTVSTQETEKVDPEKLVESFLTLEVSDDITLDRGGGHFVALRNQIEKVVELTNKNIPSAVNFSALRHDVIAEILNEYVYTRGRPMYVAVTYSDGSEAKPFPLFCLKKRTEELLVDLRSKPILDVGMMSVRHSNEGLDIKVKVYWFRNQEISIGRTQAETDDAAYKKSKEMFLRMRNEGPYRINFYQTGFQPAVVGFYRALAEELIFREKRKTSLEVTPYYFMGGTYKVGKSWN